MSAQSFNLIPQPVAVKPEQGIFHLTNTVAIATGKENRSTAMYLQQKLNHSTGIAIRIVSASVPAAIVLKTNASLDVPAEGYLLSVNEKQVVIEGKDADGVFYGVQTLLQLFPPQVYAEKEQLGVAWTVPAVTVKDYPRFHYRGMMLDVVRQFFDVATVKKYIDWLSMHKINRFHWHLTDDEGWRVEIKKYPKLTSVAAWRGQGEALAPVWGSGDKRYGGFYTQKQIKEVVRYAADRHVEIIPEIDLPGHSRAAAAAYPEILCPTSRDKEKRAPGDRGDVWCVGNEANFTMLGNILKELAALFPSNFIHIGGDEVNLSIWPRCPLCSAFMKEHNMQKPEELQNYFVRRLSDIIHSLGKQVAGWDEILDGGNIDASSQVYAWRSLQRAQESVKKGIPAVVMAAQYLYFDMAQSKYDRGHNWASLVPLDKVYFLDPCDSSLFTPAQTGLIRGVQGCLWAELLNEPPRFMEYQSYPRICALAEIGWTPQALKNWSDFYRRLTTVHFERMYNMGIAFRVPPPVADYKNGEIFVTMPFEGADVRYTTDGSQPEATSPRYKSPITDFDYEKFRFRTFYRNMASIAMPAGCASPGMWNADMVIKPQVQSWNLAGIVDRPGIWYASFVPSAGTKGIASVSQVRIYENDVLVASDEHLATADGSQRYRLPLYAFDKSKQYTMKALVQGKTSVSSGSVTIERSPYQEPPVGVSVGVNLRGGAQSLTDYNFDTAVSTADPCKAGQSLTFVFAAPVHCSLITAVTGFPINGLYDLKEGHLEVSYDGQTWLKEGKFAKGKAVIRPSKPVKAVKIVVDAPSSDPEIVFQDLRIE